MTESSSNSYGYRNFTSSSSGYSYDENGNLTADAKKGTTLTYNELNKVLKITQTASPNKYVEYGYDAAGIKISKTAYDGSTTKTINYIGAFEFDENNALTHFAMPEGRVRKSGSSTYTFEYFITDHQGNVRVSFEDNSGTAVVRQENSYYPYGMIMAGNYQPSAPNQRLYNTGSQWQDEFSGTIDYFSTFFREYDPVLGRFNSVDPRAEVTVDLSIYHYAGNNPINFNDPMGDVASYTDVNGNKWHHKTTLDKNGWDEIGYDWRDFEDGGGGGGGGDASYILSTILEFLDQGGNVNDIFKIFDESKKFWTKFSWYFDNGNLTGTFAENNSVIYDVFESSNEGHGPNNSGESTSHSHRRRFERFENVIYITRGYWKGKIAFTLTGNIDFTEVQDDNGVWTLKDWIDGQESPSLSYDIKENALLGRTYTVNNYYGEYGSRVQTRHLDQDVGTITAWATSINTFTSPGARGITIKKYAMNIFLIQIRLPNNYKDGPFFKGGGKDVIFRHIDRTSHSGLPPVAE